MRMLGVMIALGIAAPAHAEALKRVPAVLDPGKAYVVVEVRNRDADTAPASFVLAMYDPLTKDLLGAPTVAETRDGDRVIRVTSKSRIVRESVGSKAMVKEATRRLFLLALQPGVWTIEGTNPVQSVVMSQVTSFSLGSPTVSLVGGTVTDFGVFAIGGDWKEGQAPPKMTFGNLMAAGMLGSFGDDDDPVPAKVVYRPRAANDIVVPAELARYPVQPAQWSDLAEFGNHLGGLVNRIGGRASRIKAPAVPSTPEGPRPPVATIGPAPSN
ncbi:MAG: hypothetical protein ACKVOP_08445 [Sphingomonadaceae bacterium]